MLWRQLTPILTNNNVSLFKILPENFSLYTHPPQGGLSAVVRGRLQVRTATTNKDFRVWLEDISWGRIIAVLGAWTWFPQLKDLDCHDVVGFKLRRLNVIGCCSSAANFGLLIYTRLPLTSFILNEDFMMFI